jgi:gluconate kinase
LFIIARSQELKKLWKKKTKEFLLLPVVTDILARIRRRHNLEKELAFIEAQIESLELPEIDESLIIYKNHLETQEKLWPVYNFIF